MSCPPLLTRSDALARALAALDGCGRPELAVSLRSQPTTHQAGAICGALAADRRAPVAEIRRAIRAVSAFALLADEPPDPPPASLVVRVE